MIDHNDNTVDPPYDYHKEEIDFWNKRVSWADVELFLEKHRVEMLVGADWQYECYLDIKNGDISAGADSIDMTFIGALKHAIYNHNTSK